MLGPKQIATRWLVSKAVCHHHHVVFSWRLPLVATTLEEVLARDANDIVPLMVAGVRRQVRIQTVILSLVVVVPVRHFLAAVPLLA